MNKKKKKIDYREPTFSGEGNHGLTAPGQHTSALARPLRNALDAVLESLVQIADALPLLIRALVHPLAEIQRFTTRHRRRRRCRRRRRPGRLHGAVDPGRHRNRRNRSVVSESPSWSVHCR